MILKCHQLGHFAKDCKVEIKEVIKLCTRCGRSNYIERNCYAKTTIDGFKLIDDTIPAQASRISKLISIRNNSNGAMLISRPSK